MKRRLLGVVAVVMVLLGLFQPSGAAAATLPVIAHEYHRVLQPATIDDTTTERSPPTDSANAHHDALADEGLHGPLVRSSGTTTEPRATDTACAARARAAEAATTTRSHVQAVDGVVSSLLRVCVAAKTADDLVGPLSKAETTAFRRRLNPTS
jgi:hypothetical protein